MTRCRVSGVSGQCSVTASLVAKRSSRADGLDAGRAKDVVGHERVVGDDLEPEPERAASDGPPDPPEPDDPEPPAAGTVHRRHQGRVDPAPRMPDRLELGQPPPGGHEQQDGVIRHLVDAVVGHVGHPDPGGRRRVHVDHVVADPGADEQAR